MFSIYVDPQRIDPSHIFDAEVTRYIDFFKSSKTIEGVDRAHLVAAIKAHGHRNAMGIEKAGEIAGIVKKMAEPGDYVVFLGAGNITNWAYALPGELAAG